MKNRIFYLNFHFLVVKFSVYLSRHVFVKFNIAPDKRGIWIIFSLFLHKNIGCGYSVHTVSYQSL